MPAALCTATYLNTSAAAICVRSGQCVTLELHKNNRHCCSFWAARHTRIVTVREGTHDARSAADELDVLVAAQVEEQRVKFGRIVQAADEAPVVWRKHPELVRRWHEEQQNR